jgi:nucleoside-diphosphate-sugar epimerase
MPRSPWIALLECRKRVAVKDHLYECYLRENTYLDIMYMPDALKAAIDLMETDPAKLKRRNAYNVTSMSTTPKIIAEEIKKIVPEFEIRYKIDHVRQAIADKWPKSINDYSARKEWNWKPDFNLEAMTRDMIENLIRKKDEVKNGKW